jgi:hypothetical protein
MPSLTGGILFINKDSVPLSYKQLYYNSEGQYTTECNCRSAAILFEQTWKMPGSSILTF